MAHLRGIQQAGFQHIKLGPPVHLAFDELQPVDLPFNLPITPCILQRSGDRRIVLPNPRRKTPHLWHGALLRALQPGGSHLGVALPDHLLEDVREVSHRLDIYAQLAQMREEHFLLRGEAP